MAVTPTKSVKIPESVHKKVASYVAINGGQISDFIAQAIEEKLQAELRANLGGGHEIVEAVAGVDQRLARLEELVRSSSGTGTAAIDLSEVEGKVMSLMEIIGVPVCAVWEMLAEATQTVTGEELERVKTEFLELGKMTYVDRYRHYVSQEHRQKMTIKRR